MKNLCEDLGENLDFVVAVGVVITRTDLGWNYCELFSLEEKNLCSLSKWPRTYNWKFNRFYLDQVMKSCARSEPIVKLRWTVNPRWKQESP